MRPKQILEYSLKRGLLVTGALITPLSVLAADSPPAGLSSFQAFKVIFALLFVLGLIFLLANFLRRVNFASFQNRNVINILATMALGSKERLLLIQVGEEQVLLSQGHGNIRKLHTLSKNIDLSVEEVAEPVSDFQGLLQNVLKKNS